MFSVKPSPATIERRQHEQMPAGLTNVPTVSATAWSSLPPAMLERLVVSDPLVQSNPAWLIFPGVSGIEQPAGDWVDQPVGSRRAIKLTDGTEVTEEIIEHESGAFRYHMTNFTGVFGTLSYGVYASWEFEPADNGTLARWTWAFPGRGPVRDAILRHVVKPLRQRYTERTVVRMLHQLEAQVVQTNS